MPPTSRITLLALHLLVSAPISAVAQSTHTRVEDRDSPGWVVDMFYGRPAFPERAQHITGEFKAHYAEAPTLGSLMPPNARVSSHALLSDSLRAVIATNVSGQFRAQDWYTYLRRVDGTWKIEAVRTLSFPRAHYVILDTLESRRAHGMLPDSLVPTFETMRLAVRPDSGLKRYLTEHRAAMQQLAERFAATAGLVAISVDGDVGPPGVVAEAQRRSLIAAMRELRLGALLKDQRSPACVFMKIGGVGDNHVGFIYAPGGCVRPPMSPAEFIYVEEVAPHWLVYKTT
jgi:hypothetical protein